MGDGAGSNDSRKAWPIPILILCKEYRLKILFFRSSVIKTYNINRITYILNTVHINFQKNQSPYLSTSYTEKTRSILGV
jgi:hypothetical protein